MLDTLFFTAEAIQDMWSYCLNNEKEIGGIGRIQRDEFDVPYVSQVIILPQEVTSTYFNITEADVRAFFQTIPEEQHPEWCFQWHSHVKMACNPSGTDLQNYKGFIELFDIFVPMIINQKGEWSGWIYNSFPLAGKYEFSNIWVYELKDQYVQSVNRFPKDQQYKVLEYLLDAFGLAITKEREDFIKAEIAKKVTERKVTYTPTHPSAGYYSGNYGHNRVHPQNNQHGGFQKSQEYYASYGRQRQFADYDDEYSQYTNPQSRFYHEGGQVKKFSDPPIPTGNEAADVEAYIDWETQTDDLSKAVDNFAASMGLVWNKEDEIFRCPKTGDEYDYEELGAIMLGTAGEGVTVA